MGEQIDDFSLICRVSSRLCALPLRHVVETLRPLPVAPVAGAPEHVLGLSLIRGVVQPVVDVARLLGQANAGIHRFVTLAVGGRRAALAVSAVLGLHEVDRIAWQALPPLMRDAGREAVAALGERDAELLLVLDSARLVPDMDALAQAAPS